MIDPAQIAAARASVRIEALIGGEIPLNRNGFACCPFHDERTASFHVEPKRQVFHCFGCGAHGDTIEWLRRRKGLDFEAAVRELLGYRGPSTPHVSRVSSQPRAPLGAPYTKPGAFLSDTTDSARAIWSESQPITEGCPAWIYLHLRGISRNIPPSLRSHPALWCAERRAKFPALIAALKNSDNRICAIQRIWCQSRTEFTGSPSDPSDSRAPLEDRKKTLGQMGDSAVRLAPAGRVLGIAEGVETGLAAMRLFHLPVWVSCGLSRLGAPAHDGRPERPPTIWIPPETEHVVVFGDNGDIGHTVAEFAAWYWSTGRRANAVFPNPGISDFNDQLRGHL